MTDYIFLSYGRGDVYEPGVDNEVEREAHFTIVEKVRSHLKAAGFSPWLDKYDLTKDRTFQESINDAIVNSRYLLLFIGKHAMQSEWCAREWKHALRHCVPIIPILLEGQWADEDIRNAYPVRVLSTDGVNKQRIDGTIDEKSLLNAIVTAIQHPVGELAVPMGARRPPAWYIEREQYTEALKKQLGVNDKAYQGSNIIGITTQQEVAAMQGIGGIGKTTLAQAICADCDVQRNFDQIFWLDIGPERDLANVPDLMDNLSRRIDQSPQASGDLSAARSRLQAVLQGKRNLLVLDDVWAEGIVDEFSLSGVDCRLLVTTRNKSLVDQTEAIGKLETSEGLRLLATIFDRKNPELSDLNEGYVAIIDILGGHTLAIEMAGKWLKKYKSRTVWEYLERLQSDQGRIFQHLQMSKTDKNANLELSLALSYADLDADTQGYFRQLGILAPASTVSEADLAALWDVDDALEPLYALLDLGLLDETPDGTRYSQHPLIRAYAAKLLSEADETDAAFGRYVDYITPLARNGFRPPAQWSAREFYMPHIDHIGDELVSLWSNKVKYADIFVRRVADFSYAVTNYTYYRPQAIRDGDNVTLLGMDWLQIGLEAYILQGNKRRQALMLNQMGLAWKMLGDVHRALHYYERALKLRRDIRNKTGEGSTLNNIGGAWHSIGEFHKALEYYEQALAISREIGNRASQGSRLSNIGEVWRSLGKVRKALEYYEQALDIDREVGDKAGEGTTLSNIGLAWNNLGERSKALEYYEQALVISREIRDRVGEGVRLNNIGGVWSALGEIRKALDYYEQALVIHREVGNKRMEGVTLINIGYGWSNLGKVRKALEYYEQALVIDREMGNKRLEAVTLDNIGVAWLNLGERRKALDYYEQSLLIAREVGDKSGEVATLNNIGSAWDSLGERRKALEYYEQALVIFREVGDKSGEGTTLNNIGLAWYNLGEVRKALDYYEQALLIRREVGAKSGEGTTLNNIGLAWSNLGDRREALEYYEQALGIHREVGNKSGEAGTCYNMASIYDQQGDLDQAISYQEICVRIEKEIEDPHYQDDLAYLEQLKARRDAGE